MCSRQVSYGISQHGTFQLRLDVPAHHLDHQIMLDPVKRSFHIRQWTRVRSFATFDLHRQVHVDLEPLIAELKSAVREQEVSLSAVVREEEGSVSHSLSWMIIDAT